MPEIMTTNTKAGRTLHTWTIQEYEQHSRLPAWYWIMGGLGSVLVLYGMFTGNFLFAIVIILYGIILFLQSHQSPPQVPFKITDLGVIIGAKFYPYGELDGFYIIYDPPEVKMLYIETKSPFKPLLRIPLLDENPLEIRASLLAHLEEDLEKEEEPLGDHVARKWQIH